MLVKISTYIESLDSEKTKAIFEVATIRKTNILYHYLSPVRNYFKGELQINLL